MRKNIYIGGLSCTDILAVRLEIGIRVRFYYYFENRVVPGTSCRNGTDMIINSINCQPVV